MGISAPICPGHCAQVTVTLWGSLHYLGSVLTERDIKSTQFAIDWNWPFSFSHRSNSHLGRPARLNQTGLQNNWRLVLFQAGSLSGDVYFGKLLWHSSCSSYRHYKCLQGGFILLPCNSQLDNPLQYHIKNNLFILKSVIQYNPPRCPLKGLSMCSCTGLSCNNMQLVSKGNKFTATESNFLLLKCYSRKLSRFLTFLKQCPERLK